MKSATASRPTWAEINLENLAFNYHSSREFIGSRTRVMAVVKADAYGHGAAPCANRLQSEGVDWFGVALLEEGLELRNAGITKPILLLGGFWPGQENVLLESSLTPAIFRIESAEALDSAAAARGITANFHLKIDTGMGRVGVLSRDISDFAEKLKQFRNLSLEGVMTHFASADDLNDDFTERQIEEFQTAVSVLRSKGFAPKIIDMANSPGAIARPASRGNLVRLGGILYGLGGDVLPAGIEQPVLKPVMSLHSRIAALKKVPSGTPLGYGRTFTTRNESIIATVPIGYHDGYPRSLSNAAKVIINGTLCPVVGRISMDWTLADVTNAAKVSVMDEVLLIGESGSHSILAEDLAGIIGTISYEITCGIGSRVPRVFIR